MRLIVCFAIVLTTLAIAVSGEQQRILRRVIKSTPTANQLTRIRAITVRSPNAESGGVTEISSKEAASFGQRSTNETTEQQSPTNQQQQAQQISSGLKTKVITSTTSAPTTTTSPTSPSTTTTTTTSTTSKPQIVENSKKNKASDRQQAAQSNVEVELLSSAPSSWQTMTAVEAPAAMLIATGTRAASTSDLASAGSTLYSSEESASQTGDFLRASGTKGGSSFQQSNNEAFSRLRQQSSKTQQQQQQQQSFFYPQEQRASSGKTSFASKTPWYQTTTTTTPRPAPLIQEQQYEQQNEQYVEQQQQQQVEYGAPAPLGQAEPFAFDFKTQDNSGNGQYRKEESDKNGVVRGSYGYTDANGIYRHVEYVADQNGFRANIKSNEPGLIGETQPASIQLASGASPARVASPRASPANNNNNDNGDWISSSASNNQGSSADLALAPPEFESSHKPERARLPRQYRN